jgi:ubiquinone/menaquinone biosynthesis C-methylase UbiE
MSITNNIKLNLGCSNTIKEGYLNIDLYHKDPRVKIADVRDLSFLQDRSCEEIIAHDVLEHLPFQESSKTLKEWCRVLKIGGRISIQTTNLQEHILAFINQKWSLNQLNYMLFAGIGWTDGISRDHDWHKSIYTIEYLTQELLKNNVQIIDSKFNSHINAGEGNLNLYIIGEKI